MWLKLFAHEDLRVSLLCTYTGCWGFPCIHTWMEHFLVSINIEQQKFNVLRMLSFYRVSFQSNGSCSFISSKQSKCTCVWEGERGRELYKVYVNILEFIKWKHISIWKWLIRAKSMRSQCVLLMKYEVCVHL